MAIMTPEEFAKQMRGIIEKHGEPYFDKEECHIEHDDLMCELLTQLGYGEGVAIFNETPKWYS